MRELEGGYLPIRSLPTRACEPPYLVPTYKSEGLASAPPTPAFYKTEPRARREPERRAEQNPRRHGRRAVADRGNKASTRDEPGTHHVHDVTFREDS